MESTLIFFKKINIFVFILIFGASLTVGQNASYAQNIGGQQITSVDVDDQGRRTETITTGTVQSGQTITTTTINADGTRTSSQRIIAPQSISSGAASGFGGQNGAIGTCLVGQTLASSISTAISSFLSQGIASIGLSALAVPTSDRVTQFNSAQTAANNIAQTSKEVGIPVFGVPLLPSLDSIGYCLVNSLIEYISDSTIAWINSGFEGNPVFIDNFDQFFKNIADRELASFMNNLTLPGYMCAPFQVNIQLGLLAERSNERDRFREFRNNFSSSSTDFRNGININQCSIETFLSGAVVGGDNFYNSPYTLLNNQYPGIGASGSGGDIDSFYAGDVETVRNAGFVGFLLAGNPSNNSVGAYNAAKRQVAVQQQARADIERTEITVNDGVRSTKDADGNIQTPGKIIQSQIEKRLGLDEDRLVLAREFDEVVSALVNALIKIALDEILPDGSDRYVRINIDGVDAVTGQPALINDNSIQANINTN